jgi:uncharacterized protein YbaP (TraB family)
MQFANPLLDLQNRLNSNSPGPIHLQSNVIFSDRNIQKIFEKWQNEIKDFDEQYNLIGKKIKLFLGFYKSESSIHEKRLQDLCQGVSQNKSLEDLINIYHQFENNVQLSQSEAFLRDVIKCKFNSIQKQEYSVGFTWKVTNKTTNVVHYVVGTSHAASDFMVKNPLVIDAIKNTKFLIVELKAIKLFSFFTKIGRRFLGIKYTIDDEAVNLAHKKGNKISGLETLLEQIKIKNNNNLCKYTFTNNYKNGFTSIINLYKLIIKNNPFWNCSLELRYKQNKKLFKVQVSAYFAMEVWQKGDEKALSLNDIPDDLLRNRNRRWLNEASLTDCEGKKFKGLIEFFKKTNTSTSLAVGAAHCLGVEGIIPVLQENGFEIEKLIPTYLSCRE